MDTKITALEATLVKLESSVDSQLFEDAMHEYSTLQSEWENLLRKCSESQSRDYDASSGTFTELYATCTDPQTPLAEAIDAYQMALTILNKSIEELDKSKINLQM